MTDFNPRHAINEFLYKQALDFKRGSADRRAFSEIRTFVQSLPDELFVPYHFDCVREVNER